MGIRNIAIPIDLTKTGGVVFPTENKVVYTNDTVSLTFNLTGITSYTGVTASVSLVMKDGSIFQHEKPVTASPAVFSLKENEVQHAGPVVGQVRFTDSSGSLTSQEFIFTIKPSVLDASENLELLREVEVDSFLVLKSQVEGIQLSVLANWDTIQAELETMEAGFAADWSEWFTTNKNSISAEWVALKSDISAKQATFAQDITTVEADEAARVTAESGRATAEGIRTTSESGRVGAESTRVTNENTRKASEVTRVVSESARNTDETARVTSENTRVSSENTRISQENARKTAETARVSVASADHTTAQGDHSTALADHSTAQTDHTTNLADHAIVSGYNTRLTTVESDTVVSATNLVTNGDFSNGINGWTSTTSTLSVVSGKLNIVKGSGAIAVSFPLNFTMNRKYYVKFSGVETDMSDCYVYMGQFTRVDISNYSTIHIPNADSVTASIGRVVYVDGTYLKIDNVTVIDLTATFGAGKEPTLAEMDRLMTHFSNSWFDGKQPLNTIRNLYTDKANKVQEAWITPTLVNGWVETLSTTTPVRYMKDEMGFVHIKGRLKNGSTIIAFTLPSGYRPSGYLSYLGRNHYSATPSNVSIDMMGQVALDGGNVQGLSLDGITFMAEQ